MRKVLILALLAVLCGRAAHAETIIVVDGNNIVKQQIYTPAQQVVVTQPATQQVVVTQPAPQQVVVVRETPAPRSYYYDPVATSALAGFTGAVIGNALFHHGGPRHHR